MRVFPPLGSFVGVSASALIHFARTIVNDFVINSYSIVDALLHPRSACMHRAFAHSVHVNCGEASFSFRATFRALHAANVHGFSVFSYVGEGIAKLAGEPGAVLETMANVSPPPPQPLRARGQELASKQAHWRPRPGGPRRPRPRGGEPVVHRGQAARGFVLAHQPPQLLRARELTSVPLPGNADARRVDAEHGGGDVVELPRQLQRAADGRRTRGLCKPSLLAHPGQPVPAARRRGGGGGAVSYATCTGRQLLLRPPPHRDAGQGTGW